MTLDPTFFLFAVPAVLLAGLSKGGFGSGISFIATPILALVVDPILAAGIMLPLLCVMDVASLRAYWRRWDGRESLLIVLGALPGILIGALLSRHADPDLFRLAIGLICFAFLGWRLFRYLSNQKNPKQSLPASVGLGTGLAAGFTSFVSHAGGPPVAMYLLSKGMDKTTYQACTVLIFAVLNFIKLPFYASLGFFTTQTFTALLWLFPVALAGVWIGVRAHKLVPEKIFFALAYVLLLIVGCKLVWDAIS